MDEVVGAGGAVAVMGAVMDGAATTGVAMTGAVDDDASDAEGGEESVAEVATAAGSNDACDPAVTTWSSNSGACCAILKASICLL